MFPQSAVIFWSCISLRQNSKPSKGIRSLQTDVSGSHYFLPTLFAFIKQNWLTWLASVCSQHAKLLNIWGEFSTGKMYVDSIWNVFSALPGVVEKLTLECNKYLGGMKIPQTRLGYKREKQQQQKKKREISVPNSYANFLSILTQYSELSISLFCTCEFRRPMVSRVALIQWVMLVRYCNCKIPESLSGSWNKWSIIIDLVFHVELIIYSLQLW